MAKATPAAAPLSTFTTTPPDTPSRVRFAHNREYAGNIVAVSSTSPPARPRPAWFAEFLADRGTRKPSPHTLAAYARDFDGIAEIILGDRDVSALRLQAVTRDALRPAFSIFAQTHEASSIRRCWSTWNILCEYLFSSELIPSNPMSMVARPKTNKTLAKALSCNVVDVTGPR